MKKIDLAGTWRLKQVGQDEVITAQVPGDVHSALLAAGKIPDPYFADNEIDLQWIGLKDWEFTRTFSVCEELLAQTDVFLNCDWLDTVAVVTINSKKALESNTSFVRSRVSVKKFLNAGENTITVKFKSPVKEAEARAKKLPYPIPTSDFPPVSSPHRNMLRKPACHGGWDWGVCLMVMGILGDIYIAGTSIGRIEYVTTEQVHSKNKVTVKVTVEIDAPKVGSGELKIDLGENSISKSLELDKGFNSFTVPIEIENPKLWWPNGFGEQPLYDLCVTLSNADEIVDSQLAKRLGLRDLKVQTPEDEIGKAFYIECNGVKIYAKGANWIPCDALPTRQTEAHYRSLLESAAQANMNMIRIWGGGQYEYDCFYELCDELGLMIWHDFMFSCSLYPATPEYLAWVEAEARHQVKRLRDHASIALWCGNNENVGALNWYQESKGGRDRYLVDYYRMNDLVLGGTVMECDPTRIFWPSSPSGGFGDYSDNWHDDRRGDMHYWSVWHEGKSFDAYYDVLPRFCSEFGYQAFPSMDCVNSYCPEDQQNVTSPIMEHHQRNVGGNSRITEMFTRYFRMPQGIDNFVYLSQVQQALAIKTAVEHWRHLQPVCMGTLYWQLNDNWPVASWASLEYGGKWKLLHYAAKRFYAATIASAFQSRDGKLEIWVTNDDPVKKACKVTAQIRSFDGNVVEEKVWDITAPAGGAKLVYNTPVDKLGVKLNEVFLVLLLEVDGKVSLNEHFFTEYKKCELPCADVKIKVKEVVGGFKVKLSTSAPAFYVSLNATGIKGEFDDNCFTLLPDMPRELIFKPACDCVTKEQFETALVLQHLYASY